MKFTTGDFLVVKPSIGKNILVRAKEYDKKSSTGYLEKSLIEGTPKTVTFSAKEVVANLGKRPAVGAAYGLKIEPFIKAHDTKGYGRILQFVELPEEFEDRMLKRLFKARKVLKEKKLTTDIKYSLEFRPKKGKWAGTYRHSKEMPKIDIKPHPEWDDAMIDYVMFHEHGHAIWYQRLSMKKRNSWIKRYHKYVSVYEASKQELKQMLEDLTSNGDLKSFAKDLDDEGKDTLKSALRYVRTVHKLTPHHVNSMLLQEEDLSSIWPTVTQTGKPEIHITEYSTVSPEEFFAEAFALRLTGKKLPGDIKDLLSKTVGI